MRDVLNMWDMTYKDSNSKICNLDKAEDVLITSGEAAKVNKSRYKTAHRKRVKARFMLAGAEKFTDYELLELLLFFAIPRKDVKPLAQKLLAQFKTFTNLINIDKEKLLTVQGTNENLYINFALIRELINRVLKQKIINRNVLGSWGSLLDYLKTTMGNIQKEQFRVLFLNKKNILISDEILSHGTIDHAPMYPREILKRALFHEASAIILVHNHPSGNPEPSKADIDITHKIITICQILNIMVHDHIVIASNKYFSFKSNMLL